VLLPQPGFSVLEFLLPAPVAAFLDQSPRLGEIGMRAFPRIQGLAAEEPCAVEVNVGHVEFHGAALGDFPSFVQILLRDYVIQRE